MIAPFVALQYQSTPVTMIRYAATNSSMIGTSFGSADAGIAATLNVVQPNGRVINFGGLNTYLAATGDSIYRTTDGGTTWTQVLTLASINAENHRKSGFSVVYLNGIPAVTLIYSSLDTTIRTVYSFDGLNWTAQGPFTITSLGAGTDVGFNRTIVIGSTLYMAITNTARIIIYDPGANNAIEVTPSGAAGAGQSPGICEFNNRVFVLATRTTGTTLTLFEIVGQTSTIISSLASQPTATATGQAALFVDGTNMYAIGLGADASGGLACFQVTSALAVTDISTTVLPAVLRTNIPTDSGGSNKSIRVIPVIDGVSSPGSSPTIYLYISITANGPWALYQWNGNATQISLISQGGSSLHSLPGFGNVTGSYFVADSVFPSTSGITVEITNRTFTSNGVRLSFKLYGSVGSVSFRAYVGDSTAEYPTTACTLTNPSVGAISGGTINTGLTADNGATTYQVTWASQTDGFAQNAEYSLIGNAFV